MTRSLGVGAIEVSVLHDGHDTVPPEMVLAGAPEAELPALIDGHADADGQLPVACTGLLIQTDGRTVLVDAGYGEHAETPESGGSLGASLAALGVAPADVDDVIVSHGHADHIGGLALTAGGGPAPTFSRAAHWLWRSEWDHWTSETVLAGMPRYLADPARACLPPLGAAGLVKLVDREHEVARGVWILPAPGHTPGHAAVAIESAGEHALYVGDAVFHRLNVEHPAWGCVVDGDRDAAARTRHALLDRAAADGSLVLAAHLEHPGRIERRGTRFRFSVGG